MTTNQVYRIEPYRFSQADAVLFDANVWMLIYGPTGERFPQLRVTYTLALRRIRSVKGQIWLDVLVLSEFINAYSRFVYNDFPRSRKPADFKTFRDSADFEPWGQKIAKKVEKILDKSELTESGFTSVNLRAIVRKYAAGKSDFNDQMLAELCKAKGLTLVTHDADFKGENLRIITANPNLLA